MNKENDLIIEESCASWICKFSISSTVPGFKNSPLENGDGESYVEALGWVAWSPGSQPNAIKIRPFTPTDQKAMVGAISGSARIPSISSVGGLLNGGGSGGWTGNGWVLKLMLAHLGWPLYRSLECDKKSSSRHWTPGWFQDHRGMW